jgi:8-oxo-dGTP pyrophosphatase MutT (NUDIX family)
MKNNPWKSISSKVIYENKWGRKIREHQVIRPNGKESVYAVFEINPGVCIIALTENKEIYLIGQYRFPIQKYSLELPAGGVDDGDSLEVAKKELVEETGLIAEKWTYLGEFHQSVGSSNEKAIVYLAEELTQTNHHEQEEEGISELKTISISELLEMIKRGEIVDGSTIAALLLAANHLGIGMINK